MGNPTISVCPTLHFLLVAFVAVLVRNVRNKLNAGLWPLCSDRLNCHFVMHRYTVKIYARNPRTFKELTEKFLIDKITVVPFITVFSIFFFK